eukprot:s708_g13.t1
MELIEAGLSSTAVKWRTSDGEMNNSSSDAQYQMTRPLDGVPVGLRTNVLYSGILKAASTTKRIRVSLNVAEAMDSRCCIHTFCLHLLNSKATAAWVLEDDIGKRLRHEVADLREYWKAKAKEKAMANKVARSLHKPADRRRKKSRSKEKGTTSDNGSEEAKSQVSLSWMASPLAIVKQLGDSRWPWYEQ